ncbi:nucleotide exchange factor GrpE [Phototrophicus methaneseepsis]|uniref:Protein GrpE n=1 Tax=Phototrophicus methaneseepsis TaxID=2710758 RepID=A0A7S8E7Q1_9CHLR|nr:nucleotide exchange factor GrpE [Phototrophicus methaneseepsis]QPC81874.1 nucleotide exchange factor GrpE [Phototrophicus methaneseepsis]
MTDETISTANGADAEAANKDNTNNEDKNLKDEQTTQENASAEAPAQEEVSNQEAVLQAELEAARKEAQTNMDGWQRARAEFLNYKKRTDRDMKAAHQRASLDTISKVLPIVDDFGRALENIPEDLKDNAWVNGTAMILKKFDKLLEDYDVQILDPVGEPFDPHKHEAVGMDDSSDYESGIVTTTLQKGYISGDNVLRPALVRVAS